jgi:hypothetical protein
MNMLVGLMGKGMLSDAVTGGESGDYCGSACRMSTTEIPKSSASARVISLPLRNGSIFNRSAARVDQFIDNCSDKYAGEYTDKYLTHDLHL